MAVVIGLDSKKAKGGGFFKSFLGNGKPVTRMLGNEAYFFLCRNGCRIDQKQIVQDGRTHEKGLTRPRQP